MQLIVRKLALSRLRPHVLCDYLKYAERLFPLSYPFLALYREVVIDFRNVLWLADVSER